MFDFMSEILYSFPTQKDESLHLRAEWADINHFTSPRQTHNKCFG